MERDITSLQQALAIFSLADTGAVVALVGPESLAAGPVHPYARPMNPPEPIDVTAKRHYALLREWAPC